MPEPSHDTSHEIAPGFVETRVPADVEEPVPRCPYCERAFTTRDRVDLHIGLAHYDVCDADEAAAFETAYDAETVAIREYRLKAIATVIALYFGTLMLYAVVT
jgi:hypothetical protein